MFFLRVKRRLVKKSENLNECSTFFIIFLLPVMLNSLYNSPRYICLCAAKAVTSRRSRECSIISSGCEVLSTSGRYRHYRLDFYNRSLKITSDQ